MQKFVDFIELYKLSVFITPGLLTASSYNFSFVIKYVAGALIKVKKKDKSIQDQVLEVFNISVTEERKFEKVMEIFDLSTTLDMERVIKAIPPEKKLAHLRFIQYTKESVQNLFQNSIVVTPKSQSEAKLYFSSEDESGNYAQGIKQKTSPKFKDASSDLNDQSDNANTVFEKSPSKILAISNSSKALCRKTTVFNPITGEYELYIPDRLSQRRVYSNPDIKPQEGDIVVKLSASADIPIPEGGDLDFVGFKFSDDNKSNTPITVSYRQDHIWSLELDNKNGTKTDHKLELVFRKKQKKFKPTVWLGTDLADLRARLSNETELPKHPIFYKELSKLNKNHSLVRFFENTEEGSQNLQSFKKELVKLRQSLNSGKINQTKAFFELCEYLKKLNIKYEFTNTDYSNQKYLRSLETRIEKALESDGGAICQDISAIFAYSCTYLGITAYQDNIIESVGGKYLTATLHVREVVIVDGKRLLVDPTKFTIDGSGSDLNKQKIDSAIKQWEQLENLANSAVNKRPVELNLCVGDGKVVLSEFESTVFKIERLINKIASDPKKYQNIVELAKQYFYTPLAYAEKIPEISNELLELVNQITTPEDQYNKSHTSHTSDKTSNSNQPISAISADQKIIKNLVSRMDKQYDIKILKVFLGFMWGLYYNSKTNTFSETPIAGSKIHSNMKNIPQSYREKVVQPLKKFLFDEG